MADVSCWEDVRTDGGLLGVRSKEMVQRRQRSGCRTSKRMRLEGLSDNKCLFAINACVCLSDNKCVGKKRTTCADVILIKKYPSSRPEQCCLQSLIYEVFVLCIMYALHASVNTLRPIKTAGLPFEATNYKSAFVAMSCH